MEAGSVVRIAAKTRGGPSPCPGCGSVSERLHSRYRRRLADVAVGGRRVEIMLSVRRLVCGDTGCTKRTFAEQVAGLTVRYGRRTPLLRVMLEKIAVALAGRAGARLACGLRVIVGRSTMLRLVMALPDPAAVTPRVLGVDDFALRRGHVYGTVLIDCETGAPLDLLPGRDSRPLAEWLTGRSGVELICRDRSGSYAEGARIGAPEATQVADRFHLWQNLGKAVEQCVARHRGCLRTSQTETTESAVNAHKPERQAAPLGAFAERARRHHALVHDLVEQGHGIRGIARRLGWGRHTVQRFARAATWEELVDGRWKGVRPSKLDPFKSHLRQRWEAGCTNARQLHREITALGFQGSYSLVRDYLDDHHERLALAPIAPPAPTVRQVTSWLTRHPDSLTEDDKLQLKPILDHCPELRAASGHIRVFGEMLTELSGHDLPAWISAVRADDLPGLTSFAGGLESDLDAVINGLTMRWNSGPVEGRVNHIKMIKRQMFGRAGLPLLRKRVLLTAADH
ncbi:ISL3 family transposase [Streptosporangium sp. NPDC049248]